MIIRGTTPPIRFTFSDVNPLEMTVAFLTVHQNDVTIEKELSSASSVTDNMTEWQLTQEETLALELSRPRKWSMRITSKSLEAAAMRLFHQE